MTKQEQVVDTALVVKSKLPEEYRVNPLMTLREIAKIFRVSAKTVGRWAVAGEFGEINNSNGEIIKSPGRRTLIRKSAVYDVATRVGLISG